jgi:hypothetical protein
MGRSIHVEVTAEHIAACAVVPDIGDGFKSTHPESKDPVELAIAAVAGQSVMCDSDAPDGEMATIGDGRTVLVNNLPSEVTGWIDRYYRGEAVEPFSFEIVIEDWLVALVAPTAERIAELLDDHLPRMAFRQYGQFYNDDPDFDVEAYYRRLAEAMHAELVRLTPSIDPAFAP